jgi:FkbM family methyltransferase
MTTFKDSPIGWELRRNAVWRTYCRAFRNRKIEDSYEQFYRSVIGSGDGFGILDIGANVGGKTEIFRPLADWVVAVEPDPELARLLRSRFFFRKGIKIEECAVSDRPGTVQLYKYEGNESFNTLNVEAVERMSSSENNFMGYALPAPRQIDVQCRTLSDLCRLYGPTKYIKIDAEGQEYEIISTLDEEVPLISLEFNLPHFEESLKQTLEKLRIISPRYRFNVAITEPPLKFEFDEWLTAGDLLAEIRRRGWLYIELYARL